MNKINLLTIILILGGSFAGCAGVDETPPVISEVSASSISDTCERIVWTTNERANSQVEYGLTASYGQTTVLGEGLKTHHSVMVCRLMPSATYHYRVKSNDASGNEAISKDYTFTMPDTIAPTISEVNVSEIAESSATIEWTTDEPATSQVEYGLTEDYVSTTTLDGSMVTSHSVRLSSLSHGTTYHFRVKSNDVSGNEALSGDHTLTTVPPAPTNFNVRPEHRQNTLLWMLADETYEVMIRFSTTRYPVLLTDGIQLYSGTGTSYLHDNLENGTTYYYSIWATRDVDEGILCSEESAHASGTPEWIGPHGEQEIEVLNIVGADGHRITLRNNPDAREPTWEELVSFLGHDDTDEQAYIEDVFMCGDFAEMLHNNAEEAGIMAAHVIVEFTTGPGHALNAFETTDRGLVYIDCTGLTADDVYPCSADKVVSVKVGMSYTPESIFPCPACSYLWPHCWQSLGTVTEVEPPYW